MLHRRLGLLGLCVLRATGDLWLLLRDPQRFTNHEEAYNATVGWMMWHTGAWDQLLELQYRTFCGGCTVVSALAAPTLGLFGDHFLVWKGLALVIALMGVVLGFVALRTLVDDSTAWVGAALLAIPPAGLSELGLMLWGNHQETGLFLLGALALMKWPRWQAALLGLAVVWGFTSLYFVVVLLPLAVRRDWRAIGPFLLTLTPLLLDTGGGMAGKVPLHPLAHLLPMGTEGLMLRLEVLFSPQELGQRLMLADGTTWPAATVLACAAVSLALQLRDRRWLLPALVLSFAVFFCFTGFRIPLSGQQLPPVNARYHAPWILLLTLLPAFAPGRWKALALPVVLAGLWARPLKPSAPVDDRTLEAAHAAQPWSFIGLSAGRLDPQGLSSDAPRVQTLLVALGREHPDAWDSVNTAMLHKNPRRGWGEGLYALQSCHDPSAEEMVDCLDRRNLDDEGLFGLGLGLGRDWTPWRVRELALERFGAPVRRGLAHPLSGVDRPLMRPERDTRRPPGPPGPPRR